MLRPALALLALAALTAACTPHRDLYPQLDALARTGQYAQAAELVKRSKDEYGDRNIVLYNLDRGVMLHYAGQYAESNAAFEAAEQRMDALYTESVTGNVGAFLLNDNTLPYAGEDFEQVVVNVYRALNYAALGDMDAALVEARKVNLKLEAINARYEEGQKNVYKEDGFARLLAGALYEVGGTRSDLNDAFISNRLAADAYRDFQQNYSVAVPALLAANLVTTAEFMGPEELRAARARFPLADVIPLARKQQQGQLYVVHFAGKSPAKVEDSIRAIMPDGNLLKIAFPRYRPSYYLVTGSRLFVDGQPITTLQTALPIGAIAVQNLDNRKARIATKAIARATTRYIANRALQDRARRNSEAAGLVAWLAGTAFAEAAEQADLRSWQTLPDQVLMGRTLLTPGAHRVQLQLTTGTGAVVAMQDLGTIEVAPGQTRFLIAHSIQ